MAPAYESLNDAPREERYPADMHFYFCGVHRMGVHRMGVHRTGFLIQFLGLGWRMSSGKT
jgi:hypothetical protein